MSIWDALTGRKSSPQTSSSSAPAAPAAPEHHTSTSTFQPTVTFDPTSAQGVESFLGSSSFADPSSLHPLAGLNKDTLEYLTLEDSALSDLPGSQSALPSRGFTDDLCYGTGTTYLAGLTIGGAWGLQEGLRKSVGEPPRLRLNSVLNSVTRRGPFLGNSAGVVAICYNCINSYIGYLRGKNDAANTIVAGALSGMLFKSTRGLRQMAISGGIVATVAGCWAIARRTLFQSSKDTHVERLATL
ncbi:Tim17/Tim22/Tim23/Pmp24 family-domain-containing protein [Thermothelomyces heterothallicus CBS 202.75]|uniref:Tim17/Tim22/Tim23/Pmp24 family-domain-containing protein n=1 Tax=Thermothelomyces heterothallicus CBS 202.75 TaxID=1149848 RepID=UPI0037448FCA